jgi:DNA gyrase/topoisomerase IV subunit A
MDGIVSSKYILDASKEYSIYVAENRAIPSVIDGLKHGQRMALWVLRDKAEKIKTIALSGLMSYLRLYVHGDASCNNAIGLLAAPYKNNVPLIEGLGEFGSRVNPDAIGAPRYTECRRAKAAQMYLYNDLAIVPLEDNYDGSNRQPKHFLPLIPLVLLNGVTGIAVGWSTYILPRRLSDLIAATKQALLGQPIKPLVPHFERYAVKVKPLGHNQWEFAGRAKVIDTSTVQITELPPGLPIDAFRRRLIEMEEAEQIQGFTDRSTETINITIKMRRGSIAGWTEQDAIETFKLKERVTERIVVIDWDGKAIRTYDDPESLVRDFADWRLGWYAIRFEYNKKRDLYELTYWLALQTLFKSRFPQHLGGFADRAALLAEVTSVVERAKLSVDEAQLERIASLPTYRWTKEFAAEVERTIAELRTAIAEAEAILASPERRRDAFLKELDKL